MSRERRLKQKQNPQDPQTATMESNGRSDAKWFNFVRLVILAFVAFASAYSYRLMNGQPSSEDKTLEIKLAKSKPADGTASQSEAADNGNTSTEGMVWIAATEFEMGTSDRNGNQNERPAHPVKLDGFWIDEHEVTNTQFREFVDATGYVTTAEIKPDWEEMKKSVPPGTPKPPDDVLVAGSLVFFPTPKPVPTNDVSQWWKWVPGASWKHPEGPDTNIEDRDDHPVVHVSWDDATAYTKWAGKRLPTEAEWECASRGKLVGKRYSWGDTPVTETSKVTNIWQGIFPSKNDKADGWERTSPVKQYPPNGYGLYDMSGNVWEWCSDWYRADAYLKFSIKTAAVNPTGPTDSWDPTEPDAAKRVIRGGSFLCHVTYCESYRNAARRGNTPDTGMSHLGFRCVVSGNAKNAPK